MTSAVQHSYTEDGMHWQCTTDVRPSNNQETCVVRGARCRLETVHLDVLLRDAFFDQEHGDLLTLIALKLDHLAKFLVIDDGAVASKLLLERLEKLFLVVFCEALVDCAHTLGQTLQRRQRLASVSLLDTNVNVAVGL